MVLLRFGTCSKFGFSVGKASPCSSALGRTDSWETQNVCPPCLYKVENEPPLKFNLLAAMDGNNSLKLIDSAFRAGSVRTDTRSSASPRWISPEEVDTFKDEVKKVCSICDILV